MSAHDHEGRRSAAPSGVGLVLGLVPLVGAVVLVSLAFGADASSALAAGLGQGATWLLGWGLVVAVTAAWRGTAPRRAARRARDHASYVAAHRGDTGQVQR